MVGVAVADHHRVDRLARFGAGAGEACGEVAGEELGVAAVDRDRLAVGRLQQGAVALLDVDEVELQDLDLIGGEGDLDRFLVLRVAGDEPGAGRRQDAAVGLRLEVDELDLAAFLVLFDDGHRVAPGEGHDQVAALVVQVHQVDCDSPLLVHSEQLS